MKDKLSGCGTNSLRTPRVRIQANADRLGPRSGSADAITSVFVLFTLDGYELTLKEVMNLDH
jgi:hypothetical protein